SSSWSDRSRLGGRGRVSLCELSEDAAVLGRSRFIHASKSSSDSVVGWSRYLRTKAAIPFFANASATSQPSLPIESHIKPPPGATMTAAPFALPGSGRNGVSVAVEMFRAIGSPHWRNQVSGAGWSSTPPVPSGMAWGSGGVSSGEIVPSCAIAQTANTRNVVEKTILMKCIRKFDIENEGFVQL